MKLQIIVGNHNGLTEDVLVFLNDEEKVEEAMADLKEKADLFLVLQETDELYSIAGEETTKKVSGTFSETAIKYQCEDINHCRWSSFQPCVVYTHESKDSMKVTCPQLQGEKRFVKCIP